MFTFCSECCGKPLENFDQASDWNCICIFKGSLNCCLQNRWEEVRGEQKQKELKHVERQDGDQDWKVVIEVLGSDWI